MDFESRFAGTYILMNIEVCEKDSSTITVAIGLLARRAAERVIKVNPGGWRWIIGYHGAVWHSIVSDA